MQQTTIDNQTYELFSFQDIGELAQSLATELLEKNLQFDRVVALAKGGLSQARTLTDLLAIPTVSSIQIEFYSGIAETGATPVITQSLPVNIRNQRILIFDDVVDTGETLRLASTHVTQHGAASITTAALITKPWTTLQPDFAAKESKSWVIFPNEVRETIELLEKKWVEADFAPADITARLEEIGIPTVLIKKFVRSK